MSPCAGTVRFSKHQLCNTKLCGGRATTIGNSWPERQQNEVSHLCLRAQVMDLAFPETKCAIKYLDRLQLEEFSAEVAGVASCATSKRMKGILRRLGYGCPCGNRGLAKLNVQSPAALLCICRRRYSAETALELIEFAESLYVSSGLVRLVHFESADALLSRLSGRDLWATLIESVMQVASVIAADVGISSEGLRTIIDGLINATGGLDPRSAEKLVDHAGASLHLSNENGPLTVEQLELLMTSSGAEVPGVQLLEEIWPSLVLWLQVHVHDLEWFASGADEALPCFPWWLCLMRLVVDRDIVGQAPRPFPFKAKGLHQKQRYSEGETRVQCGRTVLSLNDETDFYVETQSAHSLGTVTGPSRKVEFGPLDPCRRFPAGGCALRARSYWVVVSVLKWLQYGSLYCGSECKTGPHNFPPFWEQ